MTIEEKLKEYIISNYKSLRNFVNTSGVDMPYTTVDGIIKRGIGSASIDNVFRICDALGISADALIEGEIVPKSSRQTVEFNEALKIMHHQMKLSIDGIPMTKGERSMMKTNINICIELIRSRRKNIEDNIGMSFADLDEANREQWY